MIQSTALGGNHLAVNREIQRMSYDKSGVKWKTDLTDTFDRALMALSGAKRVARSAFLSKTHLNVAFIA